MKQNIDLAKETLDASARFWAAEYEIARRYFAESDRNRTEYSDLGLVQQQMFKEWHGSGLYGPRGVTASTLLEQASREILQLDAQGDGAKVDELLGTITFATDELRHYRSFARMRASFGAPNIDVRSMESISEGKALTELRYAHRETEVGLAAVRMSESAGLSFFMGTLAVLGVQPDRARSELDAKIIETTKQIVADERSHLGFNFHRTVVAGFGLTQWEELNVILQQISFQKLKERNQQCGNVLGESELKSIERGENDWKSYARQCLGFWYDKMLIPRERLP